VAAATPDGTPDHVAQPDGEPDAGETGVEAPAGALDHEFHAPVEAATGEEQEVEVLV
jgi:hypothetical protein